MSVMLSFLQRNGRVNRVFWTQCCSAFLLANLNTVFSDEYHSRDESYDKNDVHHSCLNVTATIVSCCVILAAIIYTPLTIAAIRYKISGEFFTFHTRYMRRSTFLLVTSPNVHWL